MTTRDINGMDSGMVGSPLSQPLYISSHLRTIKEFIELGTGSDNQNHRKGMIIFYKYETREGENRARPGMPAR